MKAITIRQPWATLIALGEKHFETRSWQTKYRGKLAIHAGKMIDKKACENMFIKETLAKHGILSYKELPTGVVLATVDLVDCFQVKTISGPTVHLSERETISGQEIAFGDYTEGRYAWKLVNLDVLLDPIQAKGQLSLWEWNQDI